MAVRALGGLEAAPWGGQEDPQEAGADGPAAWVPRRLQPLQDLLAAGYLEGEEVRANWRPSFIAWSIIIAALGAYVAFTTTMYMKQVSTTKWYWIMLVQAGLSLGVCTIWCMHFVGMQAMELYGGVQSGATMKIQITFEPVFTFSSAVAAWLIATVALHIALGRSPSLREQRDGVAAMASFYSNVGRLSSLTQGGETLRFFLKHTPIRRISFAAALVAVGVCIMHYMGMLSQTGNFSMEYHIGYIAASAVVAAVASFAGLAIFFFLFDSIGYRIVAAFVVSLAVNGMHYTGMQSGKYFVAEQRGIWGESTVGLDLDALSVLIGVLILNFTLMACTGYYVEVLETVRKREGEAFEKELRHKGYMANAKSWIQRAKGMRYPMCLVRYDTFVRMGKMVPHEALRDAHRLVYLNTVHAANKEKKKRFIVYFSHQWLSSKIPDPKNRHFQDMLAALIALSKVYRIKPENILIWVDYCSIPQEGMDQQQLAIDSIATYVSVCSAFVIVAPQVLHSETHTPCNFMTYAKRCWCRLEVFCSLIAALKAKPPSAASTTVAEGDEGGEDEDGGRVGGANMPPTPEEAVGINGLAPPPPPHPSQKAGDPTCILQEMHKVFLVVDDQLHRLNFFTKEGSLRDQYEELLYVFDGDLNCCTAGHVSDDGQQIECEKLKLVDGLCGCYGGLLEEMRRSRRRRHRDEVDDSRRLLAEFVVSVRHQIFPPAYFDSRIDALHTQVDSKGGTDGADKTIDVEQKQTTGTAGVAELEEQFSQFSDDPVESEVSSHTSGGTSVAYSEARESHNGDDELRSV